MKRFLLLTILALAVAAVAFAETASAGDPCPPGMGGRGGLFRSRTTSWHDWYYHAAWGMPVALVVPPTAELQTKWGWGVGNTEVVRIRPQFSRNYPGPGQYDPRLFKATPPWPSHTDQFGVYYVRGPW